MMRVIISSSNPGYNLTDESAMTTPAKPRPNSWQKSGVDMSRT
ncbi:MAG TPA: hypothetical protein VMM15_29270 [Bradyrhizobium sp.]|nr:hypothetical protein [Bradyrhizobium sp.]